MPKEKPGNPLVEEATKLVEDAEVAAQRLAEKGTSNEPEGLLVSALTQLSTAVKALASAITELQKK